MMIHEPSIEVAHAGAGDLADIAAMDRLARDLVPSSGLQRYARLLGYGRPSSTLSRWSERRRHVRHAR